MITTTVFATDMTAESNETVVHKNPVAGQRADYIIRVDLAEHAMPERFEQLWAKQVGATQFELCCLPFFAYGLSLYDIVTTRGHSAPDLVVSGVLRRSGHRLLRIVLTGYKSDRSLHERVHHELARARLPHEWHRAEYVAVDLPVEGSEDALIPFLDQLVQTGQAVYEIV